MTKIDLIRSYSYENCRLLVTSIVICVARLPFWRLYAKQAVLKLIATWYE